MIELEQVHDVIISNVFDFYSSGFCIDLLIRLGEKVNFTYSIHLSKDGNYGALTRVSARNTWFDQQEVTWYAFLEKLECKTE